VTALSSSADCGPPVSTSAQLGSFAASTTTDCGLRKGKGIHPCGHETDELAEALKSLFDRTVEISILSVSLVLSTFLRGFLCV